MRMPEDTRAGLVLSAALAWSIGVSPALSGEAAFPGAEGYGADAVGWRGGDLVRVTSLADEGEGTLRACAENGDRPRVCVFAVSGTIVLDRPIWVGSNLYVAGQTAPGDGIQVRIGNSSHTPVILDGVHDVVLRYLKLRPGPSVEPSANVDALTVEDSERIYLGNLSLAFATDETFNIHVSSGRATDITLADSLLALSLDRANHPDGRHSKGALICSKEGIDYECGRISVLRNLFAHHRDRNPDIKGTSVGPVEVVNNVFYNAISQFGEIYDLSGDLELAYAGNVVLVGPNTIARTPEAIQAFDWTEAGLAIAEWNNISPSRPGCNGGRTAEILDETAAASRVPPITTSARVLPPEDAFARVLARSGDTIPGRRERDALDLRVVADVRNCTGQVIDAVEQVGGWPDLAASPAVADSDGDGLPDAWEEKRTDLDPERPDDVWATDPSTGLSYAETWLADLALDPLSRRGAEE